MTDPLPTDQRVSTYQKKHPTCPGCGYEMDAQDMESNLDLYTLAHQEDSSAIECPQCDATYWVLGGWNPYFTSAWAEEDL